jgi:hypothetical protein
MNLGKPAQRKAWTYDDFQTHISDLLHRVQAIEIAITDLELDCAQYRLALANAQAKIAEALTSNPFPFDKERQKIWDDITKKKRK